MGALVAAADPPPLAELTLQTWCRELAGPGASLPQPTADEAAVLAWLSKLMGQMLAHEPARLQALAYRADLPEAAFATALRQPTLAAQAAALAQLFLTRERQRQATRRRWSHPA